MFSVRRSVKSTCATIFIAPSLLFFVNLYKKKFENFTVDLNNIGEEQKFLSEKHNSCDPENPFELINEFDREQYFLEQLTISLYNPPLTNKLFPKSNLYGHELIRYFDQ